MSSKGNKTNILILSAGTRNKIVQYFRREWQGFGKVIATDMSELAPALYWADKYYLVPSIKTEGYIDRILDICKQESVGAVLSLIDPELSLLAFNKSKFDEAGVTIVGSNYEACELSLNKFDMYKWLSGHGYKCAKTYDQLDSFCSDLQKGIIDFPVFIKPITGSASISVQKVYDIDTVKFLFSKQSNLCIQEYLNGQEIGADVYIDAISKEVSSIFTKKKLLMRAGETDKAVSFKDDKLFDLIEKFVKEIGYEWQIDIDIFNIDGEYYISEVNPRFGGGYPHAYEAGCNHMRLIKNNIQGETNQREIGKYAENIFMMKYNEVFVTDGNKTLTPPPKVEKKQ